MGFWSRRKKKEPNQIKVYYCEKHQFRTTNPVEIEEHEMTHKLEEGVTGFRFGH